MSAGLIPTGSENGASDASGTEGLPARRNGVVRIARAAVVAGPATDAPALDLSDVRSARSADRDAMSSDVYLSGSSSSGSGSNNKLQ